MLFTQKIDDEKSWASICNQMDVFKPLIENILMRESLLIEDISSVKQSTNAVFRMSNVVIKIFRPKESGVDERDYPSELFGLTRASSLGLSAPKILANGIIKDTYDFPYIITEFMDGVILQDIFKQMDANEKYMIGRKLREITDKLNTPCEPFNYIEYPLLNKGYDDWLFSLGYHKMFLDERKRYLHSAGPDKSDFVFCHGDMAPCNILYDLDGALHIIDFACALLAPVCVEHSYLVFWFDFDKSFIHGYFGEICMDKLTDMCFKGFLHSINGISLLANGLDYGFIDGKACQHIEDFKAQLRMYIESKM